MEYLLLIQTSLSFEIIGVHAQNLPKNVRNASRSCVGCPNATTEVKPIRTLN